jgi:hypothetical protein
MQQAKELIWQKGSKRNPTIQWVRPNICRETKAQNNLFMPSIITLSSIFNYSMIEIHDALLWLIQKGYYLLTLSTDSPLTLCFPQKY